MAELEMIDSTIVVLLSLTMAADAEVSSPRLERLRTAVAEDSEAVAQFWQEVQPAGTPVIVRVPDADADVLVRGRVRQRLARQTILFANA